MCHCLNSFSCNTQRTGAGSPIMADAIRRISSVLLKDDKQNAEQMYANTIDRSFVLSVDQAHAVHPNYASKHEKGHSPKMNSGMVIKRNSNQRYATNAVTGLIMKEIARKANLPILQEFVVRNGMFFLFFKLIPIFLNIFFF